MAQASRSIYPHYLLEVLVSLGGGKFLGFQSSFRDQRGVLVEGLVLFCDANSDAPKSTLSLPVTQLTARSVRHTLVKKRLEFDQFAEKATGRVLEQFAAR